MAVYSPCAGVAPEAMANAMASGMATMPTTTPATMLGIRCARLSSPARCASRMAIMCGDYAVGIVRRGVRSVRRAAYGVGRATLNA